jgi:hypothetical protein
MIMNAFKKILVSIAVAATLGVTAFGSTQASAWCGDYGYSSYGYSPSYNYDSYNSYGYNGFDRHDRFDFRGHDRRESRRH